MSWVRVCADAELLPGEHRVVEVDSVMVAVYNVDGELYAIEDVCSHDGGELASGSRDGLVLTCPRHGAQFDLRTGEALCAPAYSPATVFPVKRELGAVWTMDDRW
jgi:3-phenylpropionate/trans-cinnamate dioxygenase ferredoxin component